MAKSEGLDKLIVIPAHWQYDNLDSFLHTRERNGLAVNPRSDLDADIFDMVYCEDAADNETACGSPDAVAEITLAPAYSALAEEFGIAYYVRLLGGLERFGLYPGDIQLGDNATASITKLAGGTVEVTDTASNVAGAKIVIPADPYPDRPESFTPSTAIPINDPLDTNDCMWEDMNILVAERINPPDMDHATPLGPAVQFGPYRALFNRDVTITIPYDTEKAQANFISPYIYNHVTEMWDELQADSCFNGLLNFKTQCLGVFRAGISSSSTPCAATVAMRNDREKLNLLRKYRDTVLKKTPAGRILIRQYYALSPFMAELMKDNEFIKLKAEVLIEIMMPVISAAME